MSRKKVTFLTLIILIVGTILFVLAWFKSSLPSKRFQAEQAVYEILIDNKAFSSLDELTVSDWDCSSTSCMQSLLEDFHGLKQETITDLLEQNKQSYQIRDFLPQELIDKYFNPSRSNRSSWHVSFSRIAFDPSLSQALALVIDCRGSACNNEGNSYIIYSYVFLQKIDGEWYIRDEKLIVIVETLSD